MEKEKSIVNNNESNNTCNVNATGEKNSQCDQVDSSVVKQYKLILGLALIFLVICLGLFIYNLIKCYLPKWRKDSKRLHEEKSEIANQRNVKIELESREE